MDAPVARLAELLARCSSESFCDACLGRMLGLDIAAVRQARRRLANEIVLRLGLDRCAGCQRRMLVVGCLSDERDGDDAEVLAFLGRHPGAGSGLCHSCIARGVPIASETLHRLMPRLRIARGLRLITGPCAICKRSRLLVSMPREDLGAAEA
jgi:hypothetical protein